MRHVRNSIQNASFSIREISEKAAAQDDTIRLDIGQPDFATPNVVQKQLSLEEPINYTSLWGTTELRNMIADYESHKQTLSGENVMVTTGGTGAIYCALNGLLDKDDSVLMNDPAWPPYKMIAAATPGTAKQVPYFTEQGDVDTAAITAAVEEYTAAIIINTPENPTGRVYTEEQIKALCDIAEEHDLWVIADEVYDKLLYAGEHYSPMQYVPERTILIGSLSKNFAMTGWRLGWLAATDEALVHELGKVNRGTTACPNHVSQHAALIALDDAQDYAAEMRETYSDRRDVVMRRLDELGWDCVAPNGAFYAFPDVGRDSWDFALDLLDETGVAIVPGAACGVSSDTNVRICFGSASVEELEEAFDRIQSFIE